MFFYFHISVNVYKCRLIWARIVLCLWSGPNQNSDMGWTKAKIPLTWYAKAACVIHYQEKMEIHINE